MKIWPLGVAGWIPAFGRQTNATLIEYKNRLIIVDAGTGLSNLSGYEVILNNYEHVDLILTHYHMDHIMGLFFLPKYLKDMSLTIWGPGHDSYAASCESIIARHLDQPFGTTGYETLAAEVICKDYSVEGFKIGEINVGVVAQKHTLPSFGLTFDDKLHIATDTCMDESVFQLNVKLLLHECWAKDDESAKEHASFDSIFRAFQEASQSTSIQSIGLIHLNPTYSDTEYASWIKQPIFITQENQLIEVI